MGLDRLWVALLSKWLSRGIGRLCVVCSGFSGRLRSR